MPVETPNAPVPDVLELPNGLLADLDWIDAVGDQTTIILKVSEDYLSQSVVFDHIPEVIGIQRLLTLAKAGVTFDVIWSEETWSRVSSSAAIFPLLGVLVLLARATHSMLIADGTKTRLDCVDAVKKLLKHRFARDPFADSELVVCADARGGVLPWDFYLPNTQSLRPRDDFETLVVDALTAHVAEGASRELIYRNASALGVVVAELFENSDMHGRLDLTGKPLGPDAIRGVIFKRIKVELPLVRREKNSPSSKTVECFEVSVFDSGVGYFESYTRGEQLGELDYEWKVLHNCLERHYHPNIKDHRPNHRAMGLYEVLRAIQTLKGRIEIRTGRLYAYRTFLDSELQVQMTEKAPMAYHSWPKPKLLDFDKRYVAFPTAHESVCGSSVRIVIPLS